MYFKKRDIRHKDKKIIDMAVKKSPNFMQKERFVTK